MINCYNCQEETNNPKFCSSRCAAISNNKSRPRRAKLRNCTRCDKSFIPNKGSYRTTVCYDCRPEGARFLYLDYNQVTVGEYRHNPLHANKHPSWIHAEIRQLNRVWNADMRKLPCKNCGYNKHVELCHIKSISSFPDSALILEINSKSNIIQLCRNCHWELDHNLNTLEDVLG